MTWAALALLCAATPTLTPRAAFLGTPERSAPQLSPDASLLAYLAVDRNQVSQLVVRPLSGTDAQAKVLTQEPRRSLRRFAWAEDSRTLLVLQDEDGDENFHLAAIDALDGNRRELTPFAGGRLAVRDLGSTNGTCLAGGDLRERGAVPLRPGAWPVGTPTVTCATGPAQGAGPAAGVTVTQEGRLTGVRASGRM